LSLDQLPAALVHHPVVALAKEHAVVEIGLATLDPVHQVMPTELGCGGGATARGVDASSPHSLGVKSDHVAGLVDLMHVKRQDIVPRPARDPEHPDADRG